jgi:hypothetical protein
MMIASFKVSPLAHIRTSPSIKATLKPFFSKDEMESRFFFKLGTYSTSFILSEFPEFSLWFDSPTPLMGYW